MDPGAERYRDSWRLRIPPDPEETRRIERWLATARVGLAASTLLAIWLDPTELGHSWAAYGLFVFYLANAILILMLLRRRQQSTSAFRLLVHAGDIAWPALISIFAEGPRTPFFLFFFFVLAAAAYRWGLWETLGTALAEVALLWIERPFLLHFRLSLHGSSAWNAFFGLRVNVPAFDPYRLFMLSVYLIVMGLLLGYLAEQQKHLRAEKAMVNRILSRVRVEAGLNGTLEQIFSELISMYGASELLVASQESHSHRIFVGELKNPGNGAVSEFRWLDSAPRQAKMYLDDFPGDVCYAVGEGDEWKIVALDAGRETGVAGERCADSASARTANLPLSDYLGLSFWRRMERPGLPVQPELARREAGGAAISAESGAADRAGDLQRLSPAPAAEAGQRGRARSFCPGTA